MLTNCYRFASTNVAIRTEDAAVHAAVGEIFDYFGISALDAPAGTAAEIEFDLSVGREGLAVPADAHDEVKVGAFVRIWQHADYLFLSDSASVFALDKRIARGRLDPDLLRDANALRWRLLEFVILGLMLLLRRRGLFPLHAAALQMEGQGLLLIANSDCGKSTLAYSLVRQGWGYLSDDAILLDATCPAIRAHPFRRAFGLDFEAQDFFPELAAGTYRRQFAEEEKWAMNVNQLYPTQAAEEGTPRVLVFPQIVDDTTSRLVEIGQAEALFEVVGQSAFLSVEPDMAPVHMDALRSLVEQTRHYRLLSGRDIVENPSRASELLAPLL